MKYDVLTVEDHELPERIDRVIVERDGQDPVLIITESVARSWRFMEAWEASVEADDLEALRLIRAV